MALYFEDYGDYESALWSILFALDPGTHDLLKTNEESAYDSVTREETPEI